MSTDDLKLGVVLGPSTIGHLWPDPDGCTYRGWKDALAGRPPGAAPNYIRHDPVLWSLYMYGYRAAKEALTEART